METLIINKRRELPVTKRLLWDGMTLLLWGGWIYLWKPLLVVFYEIVTLKVEPEKISDVLIRNIGVIPFETAIFMLLATPAVLFVLSRLNRHKAQSEHLVYEPEDYAEYFDLDPAKLHACVQSSLVTVHHDAHGDIIRIEQRIAPRGETETAV